LFDKAGELFSLVLSFKVNSGEPWQRWRTMRSGTSESLLGILIEGWIVPVAPPAKPPWAMRPARLL
jgi:hypothetical protein